MHCLTGVPSQRLPVLTTAPVAATPTPQEASYKGHRANKVLFLGNLKKLLSTGTSRWNNRQMAVWDQVRSMGACPAWASTGQGAEDGQQGESPSTAQTLCILSSCQGDRSDPGESPVQEKEDIESGAWVRVGGRQHCSEHSVSGTCGDEAGGERMEVGSVVEWSPLQEFQTDPHDPPLLFIDWGEVGDIMKGLMGARHQQILVLWCL